MGTAQAVQGFVGEVMQKVTAPIDALNLAVAEATLAVLQVLPKMPAARLYSDFVFQFGHSHPHPPTFGVPIPSTGPVLASGCMSVLINSLPAARNGDMGLAVWCGGYFPIFEIMAGSSHVFIGGARAARQLMDPTLHCLPDVLGGKPTKMMAAIGKLEVAGSLLGVGMSALNLAASVEGAVEAEEKSSDLQGTADAASAAAAAAAAGVGAATAAAQLAADVAAAAMGLLMGKDPGLGFPLGMILMGSPNVLIGGFPMPGWDTILKGLFKVIKPIIRKVQLKLPPGRTRNALCAVTGHPVEIASGRMFSSQTDFEIEGRIPIIFDRLYDTSSIDYESPLGWGWTHPYDQHLWESTRYNCLILRNEENRQVRFNKLKIGERYFQPLERVWLERTGDTEYQLFDCKNGLYYKFTQVVEGDFNAEKTALRLTEIFDRNSNRLQLRYESGLLVEINPGSGDFITFHYHDSAGRTRLFEIRHHLKNNQNISLMKFGYNGDSELISAANRTYVPYTYLYENHLMTRETNRNGLSFHFKYDGEGQNARCIHTYGDGGIYDRQITYLPQAKVTKVKDGLGGETIYYYNDFDLVTKIFDAIGGVVEYKYGESGELLEEIDELGRTKRYQYDEHLNISGITEADGTTRLVEFNDFSQPVVLTDENGSQWLREYDPKGNIVKTINPLGAERLYEYNRVGDVVKFRDALGSETVLEWNSSGQISSVTHPLGEKSLYLYNERNFVSEILNEFTGLKTTYQYDDLGRVKRIAEINSRKETISVQRYEYDDQNNLLLYVDSLGNRTVYSYSGYDKLAERTDALGYKRKFRYDKEERLNEIINERGEEYTFKYDLVNRVIEETGFDRAQRIYQYNQAGELVFLKDALNRETYFQRDAVGQITRRLRSDSTTVNYVYDKCRRITQAQTANNTVSLTYDAAWQIVSENQNGQTVNYEYDAEGRRIARILVKDSANPSRIDYDYDADSNLSLVKVGNREFNYERDRIGRLTNRQLPNGLSEQIDYDINGRLSGQKITVGGGGREIVKRGYQWDALGNVVGVTDSLRGARRYSYDAVERLNKVERIIAGENTNLPQTNIKASSKTALPADKRIWQADDRAGADFGQREVEEFQYDGDGNLLERKSSIKGSRQFRYGAGDRLSQQDKVQYIYDAVGNLIQKRQANGAMISYQYDADNQLISISTETGGKVEFQYDAFGRRTAKISEKGTIGFLWDGDVLMSEIKDSQISAEYVHEGFVPLAKIKDSQIEIYHTDYLGTPKEVTNQQGEIVWQGNYDEYGKVTSVKGATEQNIRFQGQYEDTETGLFYNNFRYYDADACRYINQDPLNIDGEFNFYGYCPNPVNWVDELGLAPTPAPVNLPNTPGVYIITNGNDSYVGSAGIGGQGMNQRTSSGSHAHAQNLLSRGGTTVQYIEVHGLNNVTASKGRTADGNRNIILRYYEQQQLNRQAKSKNMLNGRRKDGTLSRILSLKKTREARNLIRKHGITADRKRTTC